MGPPPATDTAAMKTYAVEMRIAEIARTIVGPGVPVSISSTFEDLALDSLSCIELVTAVEDEFGVDISCAERIGMDSIADLSHHVQGLRIVPTALAA